MVRLKKAFIFLLILCLLMPAAAFAQEEGTAGLEKQANTISSSQQPKYMLISNESTNPNIRQSTGTPAVKKTQYSLEQKLKPQANKIDVNLPFDIERFEDRKIQRRSLMRRAMTYEVGNKKWFTVFNFYSLREVRIEAQLLYSGKKANVWAHGPKDRKITEAEAEKIGKEFDEKIHPLITKNFAGESDVDGNGKVEILCYDIKDGFPDRTNEYIAGYFYAGDLYNVEGSNQAEIFYIDTYPSMYTASGSRDITQAYSTLAHEFQHMVNFNQNVFVEGGKEMDPWLDEGLSMAAEQMYEGKVLKDRIDDYNKNNSIRNGHSLLYWDDYGDVIANYSLSYLFIQYIRTQSKDKEGVYKRILKDPNSNYKAVQNAMNKPFGKLMTDFRGALLLKEKTGKYGFNGEPGFSSIRPRLYGGTSANLRGGGAVAMESTGKETIPTSKGKNITYTFFGPGEPKDHTAPAKPVVQKVSDRDTAVKGKAEAGATVYVKAGSKSLGSTVSNPKKEFSLKIRKQKAGTKLQVYAMDKAGNKSDAAAVTVIDKTPPSMPTVYRVSNKDLKVSGKAEAGSRIRIKARNKVIGIGTTDKAGKYTVKLKAARKEGTAIYVSAKDKAGNVSKTRKVIVVDKIPPRVPKVSKVTDRSTAVKGTAEVNSTVYVKAGKKILGSAKASSKGKFYVKMKKQRAGTVLKVYAKDRAGNVGKDASVKVIKV